MIYRELGGGSALLTILLFLGHFLLGKRRKRVSSRVSSSNNNLSSSKDTHYSLPVSDSGLNKEKRDNLNRMSRIAALYKDYTAEVIPLNVTGRKRVKTFRLLNPGNEVELRYIDEDIKVFAFNEFIADLFTDTDSHIGEVMEKGIPFHAYLGGRNLAFLYNENFDSCSIIVFYELPGVASTKVLLQG